MPGRWQRPSSGRWPSSSAQQSASPQRPHRVGRQPRDERGPLAASVARPARRTCARPGRPRAAPRLAEAVEPGPARDAVRRRSARPPTCLYSSRSSAARPHCSHRAAQACTSPNRSASSPGGRAHASGCPSGSQSWPAGERAEQHPGLPRLRSSADVGGRGPGSRARRGGGHAQLPAADAAGRRPADRGICWASMCASSPGPVLLDGERLQPRVVVLRVVDEPHRGHVRLDHVDLLQRGDDQQLQAEPAEQLKREPGGLVGAAAERLVDDRRT